MNDMKKQASKVSGIVFKWVMFFSVAASVWFYALMPGSRVAQNLAYSTAWLSISVGILATIALVLALGALKLADKEREDEPQKPNGYSFVIRLAVVVAGMATAGMTVTMILYVTVGAITSAAGWISYLSHPKIRKE